MPDVLIIGAGAAGIMAAHRLKCEGIDALVLEARDRVGGRIRTLHNTPWPVELGAEFVHGEPPILIDLLKRAELEIIRIGDERLLAEAHGFKELERFWEMIAEIDGQIPRDICQTYAAFLKTAHASPLSRRIAKAYVEGFNAARIERISAQAIACEDQAAEKINGEKQFRPRAGYDRLIGWLAGTLDPGHIWLQTEVTEIDWEEGKARVSARTRNGMEVLHARHVAITVPLGVLKQPASAQHSIRFVPSIPGKTEAIEHLEMGHVIKVGMQFRERFWEDPKVVGRFVKFGFVMNPGCPFSTWWTQQPLSSNLLTGWAGGPGAEEMHDCHRDRIRDMALQALEQTFRLPAAQLTGELTGFHFHNWSTDPFSRGAYSYPGIGGLDAARSLAAPVANTLFFGGEATDFCGFNGTVHGALESGSRVADEILASSG